MRFQLIDAAKRDFSVQRLCKILDVTPSGYFAWKTRPASRRQREDLVLLAHVRSAFTLSHETYGSPCMTHEVREQGLVHALNWDAHERALTGEPGIEKVSLGDIRQHLTHQGQVSHKPTQSCVLALQILYLRAWSIYRPPYSLRQR